MHPSHHLVVNVYGFWKQKMAAIKISSYPITSRVEPIVAEMVLEVKCELENGKWKVLRLTITAPARSNWVSRWTSLGEGDGGERRGARKGGGRKIIRRNCKRCRGGQTLPEAVTASFCVKFLDREPPSCWWILNGNQSWLNEGPPPSRFHYCELIRLYLSNFWSWQNVNLSWDFSLLFCLWPVALGLACCNNLSLSPEAPIIVTLLACKLFN